MDGHFVPNISFGVPIIQSLRQVTGLPLETHLMISDPDLFLDAFVEAGFNSFLVHWEGNNNLHRTVHRVKGLGNASLSFPFAEFLSIQRRSDGVEQCIFAERLEQKIHRAFGDGLYLLLLVRAGGNKNDWNTTVSARQISLQFQAIHSRHPKVED
jgi:hypothetical protein